MFRSPSMQSSRRPRAGALGGLAVSVVGLAAAGALAGCGDISRGDASSQLQASLSGLPSGIDKNAYVTCIISKLYDSGKFTSAEIQSVVKANKTSDLDAGLSGRVTAEVFTPCATAAVGGAASSGAAST